MLYFRNIFIPNNESKSFSSERGEYKVIISIFLEPLINQGVSKS